MAVSVLTKVNLTRMDDYVMIPHKDLAGLLREVADMLEQGSFRHESTAVGKVDDVRKFIKVDFDFTNDGEVQSVGIGVK